jgi:hypothetical protein
MNKRIWIGVFGAMLAGSSLLGVYAPIPEVEKGDVWVVNMEVGGFYDSNIFGTENHAKGSYVSTVSPRLKFNASITDQTFFVAYYDIELQYVENRPEVQSLWNHVFSGQFHHSFNKRTALHLLHSYASIDSPETTLGTGSLQTDQSYKLSKTRVSLDAGLTPKLMMMMEGGVDYFHYRNAQVADALNRNEYSISVSKKYAYAQDRSFFANVDLTDYDYETDDANRGSKRLRALVGVEAQPTEKWEIRYGYGRQIRDPNALKHQVGLYHDFATMYRFQPKSFIRYSINNSTDEVEDTINYVFRNSNAHELMLQYDLTGRGSLLLSSKVAYILSVLEGRP